MTTVDLRSELATELRTNVTSTAVHQAVACALGVVPTAGDPLAQLPAVGAWYVSYGETLLTLYVVTGGTLVRYEISADGRSLTTSVPLRRVARVAESNDGETVTVLVELDADRRAVNFGGRITRDAGDDAGASGQRLLLEGEMLASAFVASAPLSQSGLLVRFATLLRAAL